MGINFTASYINFIGAKLLDESGNHISTIEYSSERFPSKYRQPRLIKNIFDKGKKRKEPIITELCAIKDVENIGLTVISVPANDEIVDWKVPRYQRTVFLLVKNGSMEARKYKRLKFMSKGGELHKVIFDTANLQAQLVGIKSGLSGVGKIISLKEEDL